MCPTSLAAIYRLLVQSKDEAQRRESQFLNALIQRNLIINNPPIVENLRCDAVRYGADE